MKNQNTINGYVQQAMREFWDAPALSDYKGTALTFHDCARKVAKLHIMFERAGLKQGDRVALIGRNSAYWAVAYLAVTTYGAVAVPILNEFKPDVIHHLINHSEAKIIFVGATNWSQIVTDQIPDVQAAFALEDFSLHFSRNEAITQSRQRLNELFGKKYPHRFTAANVVYPDLDPEALMVINYTSGSTGFSKGVMLSGKNLWSNLQFCLDHLQWLGHADRMVSMLPLAHMFGLMVELYNPFVRGCNVTFLTRTPSPAIILGAFAQVKPKVIVTVPLVIEKIIRTRIFPMLAKPHMRLLLKTPGLRNMLLGKIRAKLIESFGGEFVQVIIGGAALNHEVEQFLRRINFPFTVGYGMTECAPLISYAQWDQTRPHSCGRIVDRMEAKILSPDPVNIPGTLLVHGQNVMQGYFKNPEASKQAFTADGWLDTGDICTLDADGYLYIRGRDKNMILGPSGQNIYPEEIEGTLNNLPYVAESLIVDAGHGQLQALIVPDFESVQNQKISPEALNEIMDQNIKQLNQTLPAYSQVKSFKLMEEEFEKTPKRSIKRYIYQKQ